MHSTNILLDTFDIDSTRFQYVNHVWLEDKNRKVFGKITRKDGHYSLKVWDDARYIHDDEFE